MRRTISLAVLILTAGFFFSCTQGEYVGSGGGGNFIFVDRTGALNGKYISVKGEKAGVEVGFSSATPRKLVWGGRMSAPLYDLSTGERYAGHDSFAAGEFTIWVYDFETAPTVSDTINNVAVWFYGGSGLIDLRR